MKFYKRDPDRALAGMAELSLKQRGAYNSILDLLYSRDGEVPDDDTRVAKMISCHWREWKAIKAELISIGKIWVEGGMIRAKRVQETIKEASDFGQDQSKRALKGWQKRRNGNESNGQDMPPGNALTPIDTATATISLPKGNDTLRGFDEFWSAYPKKVSRGRAEKAYRSALKVSPPERILAGVQKHRFSPDPKFIPHPASWLNDRRWLDEAPASPFSDSPTPWFNL